jgi:5'-methylthioadenosine phosphorylase
MRRSSRPVGVIAGTGVIGHFELERRVNVRTSFGSAIAFEASGGGYYVLPRHGPRHSVPPHKINYRANIAALDKLGVNTVIATSAVGSMNPRFNVGEIGLVDQFLDFTKGRESTFFDNEAGHTDMTNPYSGRLNGDLEDSARRLGIRVHRGLVYVCAEGPRFETAAEIKMFRAMGGDVVGMTGVPEVVLANEKGMQYASVVIATNWAAGMQPRVSHDEVLGVMKRSGKKVRDLIEATIKAVRQRSGL